MSRVKIGVKNREKGRQNSLKHYSMLKENPSFQVANLNLEVGRFWNMVVSNDHHSLEGFSLDFEAPLKSFSRFPATAQEISMMASMNDAIVQKGWL